MNTPPSPSLPPRERRQMRRASDRRLSIILAVLIGLVIGGGAFIMARHGVLTKAGPVYITAKPNDPSTKPHDQDDKVLLPHKALYNVALSKAKNGSQIIDIKGQMFYQIRQECDGFVTDHRFTLTYDYADSDPLRVTSDFSTVETLDGSHFDFTSRRRRNGDVYQELRGIADKTETGGTVTYTEPNDLSFALPPKTLFPSSHTRTLIDAARSGKRFVTSIIFDGSDDQGPVDVTAIISPYQKLATPVVAKGQPSTIDTTMLESPAWKVRLAFFPKNSGSETSDYELTMIIHENGLISNMTIDYNDFTVEQTLVALESLSPNVCASSSKDIKEPPHDRIPPSNLSAPTKPSKPIPDLPLR